VNSASGPRPRRVRQVRNVVVSYNDVGLGARVATLLVAHLVVTGMLKN
jgi:hypothetical protein